MLKKILIGIGGALALLLIVIALQPSKFRIERSITMTAPPEAAFAQVNDFHAWSKWSPWEKLDPNLKRSYDGPSSGAGAKYAWVGNDDVGEGRMTIEKSNAPSEIQIRLQGEERMTNDAGNDPGEIQIKLEFVKPFEATNTTIFTFAKTPEGNKTTWAMEGDSSFMGKAMGLFMNMDQMVGKDFERGLASMKTEAEAAAKASSSAAKVTP